MKYNTNRSFFSVFFFALSWSRYTFVHYTGHMYTNEAIIIHIMWAAHSWIVEPIYKHIYTLVVIRSVPQMMMMMTKSSISRIWFLLFSFSLWCRYVSNEFNKRLCAWPLFNYPCCRGFLTVLITLVLLDSLCRFANDSFFFFSSSFFEGFFLYIACQKKIKMCTGISNPLHTACHHHTGRLLTDN